jgi:cysteine-rich repeat protein
MEDTQMSSADVPQAPQPDANPAPAPEAEAPQTPAPKKGGVIMKALIGVFAVAIVGFGGWYAYNSGISGAAEDTPPSLSLGAAGFQGKSVETTFGFLQLDHADVSAHVDRPGSVYMTSETGVRWFYPKANTTFGEIESAFKPIAGMKILMAFYDAEEPWPGDSDGIKKGCFVTYPVGPYQHTCLGDLETPIDKNRGLAVITNIPSVGNVTPVFEYDSTLLGDAKTLSDGLTLPDLEGWTLHPFAAGMDLTDSKIRSVWTQTNAAEIKTQVTDVSSVDTSSEYKMMWLKLGDPAPVGDTTGGGGTPPGICGDGTVDAGETCDDGNTTDGDGCSATCTIEAACGDGNVDSGEECDDGTANSDTTADACRTDCTAASCGDNVVDAGEECDGGTDCGTDCTLTPVVTEVCGNDTIDGIDVCDGTDLGGKDCTDYITGSAFTGGTLGCAADCLTYDTSACVASSGGTDLSTYYVDTGTYTGSNLALIGSQPVGGIASSTSDTTIYQTTFSYIDNLQAEFVRDTSNFEDYYQGQLFGNVDDSDPIVVMAALRFDSAEGLGDLTLRLPDDTESGYNQNLEDVVKFATYGYSIARQPIPDYKNQPINLANVYDHYCNGIGNWELAVRYETGGIIYKNILYNKIVDVNNQDKQFFNENDKVNDFTFTDNQKYIITLEMSGLDHCRSDYQPGEFSTSETDFINLFFTKPSGDLFNVQYQSLINNYDTHDHWIDWWNTNEMPLEIVTTLAPVMIQ